MLRLAVDAEALEQHGRGDGGLERGEARSDSGARAGAEREVGVGVPGAFALRSEAGGVERLGVVPEVGMPVGGVLADDDERAGRDRVAADLLVALRLGIGGAEPAGAERCARRLIDRSPLRESGYRLLMDALAAQGNAGEAMRVYDRARTTLLEELGMTPGPTIQEAHSRLLNQATSAP
jgi:hypothetical protein